MSVFLYCTMSCKTRKARNHHHFNCQEKFLLMIIMMMVLLQSNKFSRSMKVGIVWKTYAKEKLVLTFLWPLAASFSSGKSIENSSLPGKTYVHTRFGIRISHHPAVAAAAAAERCVQKTEAISHDGSNIISSDDRES